MAYKLFDADCSEFRAWYDLNIYDIEQAQKPGDLTRVEKIRSGMGKRTIDFRKEYSPLLNK